MDVRKAIALENRKPRPTQRRQKIWHTKIYRRNQHTPLQEAGKKEPQFPNGALSNETMGLRAPRKKF